jgi:hypothetical protein
MKLKTTLTIVLMLALMLVAMLPQARGETEEAGYVWLYDNGADGAPSATTDWKFYVETPSYVGLDDPSGYWNFTVYGEMVNNTGRAKTSTLEVEIYLKSEAVNVTQETNIVVSKTARVYGNLSFSEAVYSTLVANNSATIYVKLCNGGGDTRNDTWSGTIAIVTLGASGTLIVMLPSLVGLVIIVAVVGFVFEVMADMGKVPGGKRHSTKESKRRK